MNNFHALASAKSKTLSSTGKLQDFDIVFDDPLAIYTSGDEITGKIRIVLREPMKMHMVKLRFTGVTRVTLSSVDPSSSESNKSTKACKKKQQDKKKDKAQQQQLVEPQGTVIGNTTNSTDNNVKSKNKEKKNKKQKNKQQEVPELQGTIVGKNGLVAVSVPDRANSPTVVVSNGTTLTSNSQPLTSRQIGRFHEMINLDKTIDLLERRPGQEIAHDFVLPAGVNSLPFSFLLPKKPMPASFESPQASVRYTCLATICKPWKHDLSTKRPFTVLPPNYDDLKAAAALNVSNLSSDSSPTSVSNSSFSLDEASAAATGYCCRLATPTNFPELSKRAVSDDSAPAPRSCCCSACCRCCCCCCSPGQLQCEAWTPKQVYNLGERMQICVRLSGDAKVANRRKNVADEIKVALVQNITCKGRDAGGKDIRQSTYTRPIWEEVKPLATPAGSKNKNPKSTKNDKNAAKQSEKENILPSSTTTAATNTTTTTKTATSSTNKKKPVVFTTLLEWDSNFRIPPSCPSMEIDSNVYSSFKLPSAEENLQLLRDTKKIAAGGLAMLRVSYDILVQVKVGKKPDYVKVKLPVVLIGVPFVTQAQQDYSHKSPNFDEFEFSECSFGCVDIKKDEADDQYVRGISTFAPHYPTLKIDNGGKNVK